MNREIAELKIRQILMDESLNQIQKVDSIVDIICPKTNCSTCKHQEKSIYSFVCSGCENYSNYERTND